MLLAINGPALLTVLSNGGTGWSGSAVVGGRNACDGPWHGDFTLRLMAIGIFMAGMAVPASMVKIVAKSPKN